MTSDEFKKFSDDSLFTVRRTNKFWSGTWSDMVIEQDLMRQIKVRGGLTHGRGTTDPSLDKWIATIPYCCVIGIKCVMFYVPYIHNSFFEKVIGSIHLPGLSEPVLCNIKI